MYLVWEEVPGGAGGQAGFDLAGGVGGGAG